MIPDKVGINMNEEQFKAYWWLLTLLGVFLGLVTVGFGGGQMNNVGLGIVLILMPLVGPYFYLKWRFRKREYAVARNLPDFLDMLSLTMEAGLGFMTALERVSMNSTGIFYLEIQRVLVLINLGYSRREALRELVRRLPSSDLSHLVESINLAEQLGTSLTRTLRIQTNLLRWRRRQRAEVKAHTISIRIIPALVFFFLPSLLLVYLAPPILNFLFNR
ncbi:MAG: type II secretion system F family protein [Anaerolineales bacterium]